LIETDGGSILVRAEGEDVVYVRAYPRASWRFDLLNGGPEVVDAQFLSLDNEYPRIRLQVTVIGGVLKIFFGPW
jgi:hypothetical protein